MLKINVICGGKSAEREVSLRSGVAVSTALEKSGYIVQTLDPKTNTIDEIIDCDIVFPVLHGAGGEDGTIQIELEKHNSKFVGSGSVASALCFDKWEFHKFMAMNKLPLPVSELVEKGSFILSNLIKQPFVLKPIDGGSSIDTFIVRDPREFSVKDINSAFERHPTMLLQELISGTELTVGILGDEALPIIKVIPPENGEFDYSNKYNGKSQEIVAPKDVDQEIQKSAQGLALKSHQLTGCRDFSRSDMIYDKTGTLYFLETNTIPGMTDGSLFPKMAAAAGLDMPALCKQLVLEAFER